MCWTPHISNTAAPANKTLGFLHRNLSHAPPDPKEKSYKVFGWPKLEYLSAVWDPHKAEDKCLSEKVQHRAALFATGRCQNRSSVSDMFDQVCWESLEQRRLKVRETMAYWIRHQLMAIPADPFLKCPTWSDRMKTRMHSHAVPVLFARTDYLKHSLFHRTPVIRNQTSSSPGLLRWCYHFGSSKSHPAPFY